MARLCSCPIPCPQARGQWGDARRLAARDRPPPRARRPRRPRRTLRHPCPPPPRPPAPPPRPPPRPPRPPPRCRRRHALGRGCAPPPQEPATRLRMHSVISRIARPSPLLIACTACSMHSYSNAPPPPRTPLHATPPSAHLNHLHLGLLGLALGRLEGHDLDLLQVDV
eukprot:scaffold31018_cov63-Phaeocystis_antarctica.AAC.10